MRRMTGHIGKVDSRENLQSDFFLSQFPVSSKIIVAEASVFQASIFLYI